jgi:hypothetical protein
MNCSNAGERDGRRTGGWECWKSVGLIAVDFQSGRYALGKNLLPGVRIARRIYQNPMRPRGIRFLTNNSAERSQNACPALTRRVLIRQSTFVSCYKLRVLWSFPSIMHLDESSLSPTNRIGATDSRCRTRARLDKRARLW